MRYRRIIMLTVAFASLPPVVQGVGPINPLLGTIPPPPIYNAWFDTLGGYAAAYCTYFSVPGSINFSWGVWNPANASPGPSGTFCGNGECWRAFPMWYYKNEIILSDTVGLLYDNVPIDYAPLVFGEIELYSETTAPEAPTYYARFDSIEGLECLKPIPLECNRSNRPLVASARYGVELGGAGSETSGAYDGAFFYLSAYYDESWFDVEYETVRVTSADCDHKDKCAFEYTKRSLGNGTSFMFQDQLYWCPCQGDDDEGKYGIRDVYWLKPNYVKVSLKVGRRLEDLNGRKVILTLHTLRWAGSGDGCDDSPATPPTLGDRIELKQTGEIHVGACEDFTVDNWNVTPPPLSDECQTDTIDKNNERDATLDVVGTRVVDKINTGYPSMSLGEAQWNAGRSLGDTLSNRAYHHAFQDFGNPTYHASNAGFVRVSLFGVWFAIDDVPWWRYAYLNANPSVLRVIDECEQRIYEYLTVDTKSSTAANQEIVPGHYMNSDLVRLMRIREIGNYPEPIRVEYEYDDSAVGGDQACCGISPCDEIGFMECLLQGGQPAGDGTDCATISCGAVGSANYTPIPDLIGVKDVASQNEITFSLNKTGDPWVLTVSGNDGSQTRTIDVSFGSELLSGIEGSRPLVGLEDQGTGGAERTVTWDANTRRLLDVKDAAGKILAKYEYDAAGRLTKQLRGGAQKVPEQLIAEFTYAGGTVEYPLQACCLSSGCEMRTWQSCIDSDGVPKGLGSDCATLECDEGACCLDAGGCSMMTLTDCLNDDPNNDFEGLSSVCNGSDCDDITYGMRISHPVPETMIAKHYVDASNYEVVFREFDDQNHVVKMKQFSALNADPNNTGAGVFTTNWDFNTPPEYSSPQSGDYDSSVHQTCTIESRQVNLPKVLEMQYPNAEGTPANGLAEYSVFDCDFNVIEHFMGPGGGDPDSISDANKLNHIKRTYETDSMRVNDWGEMPQLKEIDVSRGGTTSNDVVTEFVYETSNNLPDYGYLIERKNPEVEISGVMGPFRERIIYAYDDEHRVTTETRYGDSNPIMKTEYFYDAAGYTTKRLETDMTGMGGTQRCWQMRYNAFGDEILMMDPEGNVTAKEYNSAGQLKSTYVYTTPLSPCSDPSSASGLALKQTDYQYVDGRLSQVRIKDAEVPFSIGGISGEYVAHSYNYDDYGRLTSKVISVNPVQAAPNLVTNYEYDFQDRLTKLILPARDDNTRIFKKWIRDGRGLITQIDVGHETSGGGSTVVYTSLYYYDANGYLTKRTCEGCKDCASETDYYYDQFNRMTRRVDK